MAANRRRNRRASGRDLMPGDRANDAAHLVEKFISSLLVLPLATGTVNPN
jgi:hypothetical protein